MQIVNFVIHLATKVNVIQNFACGNATVNLNNTCSLPAYMGLLQ